MSEFPIKHKHVNHRCQHRAWQNTCVLSKPSIHKYCKSPQAFHNYDEPSQMNPTAILYNTTHGAQKQIASSFKHIVFFMRRETWVSMKEMHVFFLIKAFDQNIELRVKLAYVYSLSGWRLILKGENMFEIKSILHAHRW